MPTAAALSPDGFTAYVTEANSVCAIDVRDALKPGITDRVRDRFPQAVLATADRVYVSNALDDSITVISAGDRKVVAEIPLGIPSLEQFRGIMPAGLAYDPVTKWLLVAETGINAVGVVDTEKNQLIGHIPAGWMPTRVAIAGDRVYVTNARGRGTGPNPRRVISGIGRSAGAASGLCNDVHHAGRERDPAADRSGLFPERTCSVYARRTQTPGGDPARGADRQGKPDVR